MTLAAGTRLGPYEILSLLGAGGMGEVYRARDTKLGRDVAVKVLPEAVAQNPDVLTRFEREAHAVAALNHPNILSIFDFGSQDGVAYAAMELLEGETLRTRLEHGALPARKAIDLAVQMAEGLAAAHEKGIVHRDLKPENIFVTGEGRVKLLDFGLAKTLNRQAPETNAPTTPAGTEPGVVMGTVGYMSPEQVRGKPADHGSDIFSFGAVLYEMLTGRRAFQRDTSAETMTAILKEDPPEMSAGGPGSSPALSRIVQHCLEKKPGERFQSARDIAFALDALSGTLPAGQAQALPSARASAKARPALGILAALVVVAAMLGVLVGSRFGRNVAPEITFKPLNFRAEAIFNPRFAPDGRTVFYSSALSGNEPELFMVSPDYPEARAMGLKHTALLSVSSKGELAVLTGARWVAHEFFVGTLARMPLGGGAPREIIEGVNAADWSPDGSELAILREVAGMDRLEYPPGKILSQTAGYFSDLRISPDGQHIALFEHPWRYDNRGSVVAIDLQGKKTILSQGWASEEGLAWSADGREILFSATIVPLYPVRAVDLAGKSRIALASAGGMEIRDVSRDGHWLVKRQDGRNDLFALAPGERVERNLSWLDWSSAQDLSADGRRLLFVEYSGVMGPNYAVGLRGTDGSPPVRLGEGSACGLSPDSKLALAIIPTSPGQLMLYPIGAGETRRLERGPITDYSGACWFRDGKRILVSGSEPGHAPRCYVQEIAGGAPRAVTPEGTSSGLISPDGNLACVRNGSGQTLIVPIAGGEPRVLPFVAADEAVVRWTPDGRSLLVNNLRQVPSRLERVEIATGRRETLRTLAPPDLAGVLSITPVVADDLTSYAYTAFRQRSSLFLVEGAR